MFFIAVKNDCSQYINKMIEEAKKLRTKCPIKEAAVIIPKPIPVPAPIPQWMKYAGFVALFLLLAGLLTYLVWRSKFWQHLSGSKLY